MRPAGRQVLALRRRMEEEGVEGDAVTAKLTGRAAHGWAPTRRPPTPNDPLRKGAGASSARAGGLRSFKDDLASL